MKIGSYRVIVRDSKYGDYQQTVIKAQCALEALVLIKDRLESYQIIINIQRRQKGEWVELYRRIMGKTKK